MNWNIKVDGESIEKLAAKNIEADVIEKYNAFWGNYVGNVRGKPAIIEGISEDDNRKRLLLAQWCYTLLQNQLFLKLNEEVPKNIKEKEHTKIAKSLRIFNEATHLLYNSIELIEKYNQSFDNKYSIGVSEELKSFKKFRNVLAHNVRPIVKINYVVEVPKNFEVFKDWKPDEVYVWTLDKEKFASIEYWGLDKFIEFVYKKNQSLIFDLLKWAVKLMQTNGVKSIPPLESISFPTKSIKSKNIPPSTSGITDP